MSILTLDSGDAEKILQLC